MLKYRIIPTLLLKQNGLVKGIQFKNHTYVGDPVNVIRIFNTKEVDELILLDIEAYSNNSLKYDIIKNIVGECFMPLTVGGGIKTVNDVENLINIGVEKVVINTAAIENPNLITEVAQQFGSQAVIVAIDYKLNNNQYEVFIHSGTVPTGITLEQHAKRVEQLGAGEIMITSIDKEGTRKGYDIENIRKISSIMSIPIIASGGADSINDFKIAIKEANASAVAAGTMFTFVGAKRAVLINYPKKEEINKLFDNDSRI